VPIPKLRLPTVNRDTASVEWLSVRVHKSNATVKQAVVLLEQSKGVWTVEEII